MPLAVYEPTDVNFRENALVPRPNIRHPGANQRDPFLAGDTGVPDKDFLEGRSIPGAMDCQNSDKEPHAGPEPHIKSSLLGRFWLQASPGHIRTDDRARDSTRVSGASGLRREPLRENEKMASVPKVTCKFQRV